MKALEFSAMDHDARWQPFADHELEAIWRAIVFDDGVMYPPENGTVEYDLLEQVELEWKRRGRSLDVSFTHATRMLP